MEPNRNYVAALARVEPPPKPKEYLVPQQTLSFPMTSTQVTSIDTNAVDRAKGGLIASIPRTFSMAITASILSIIMGGVGVIVALLILFCVFSVLELVSYYITLLFSADGIAMYEARRKWDAIDREQLERWKRY